jgi:hypothetical protein
MLEVGQLKYFFQDVERQMRLFVNHLPNDLYYLALEDLIVVAETLNQEFQFCCLFLVDDRGQEVMNEVLEAGLV